MTRHERPRPSASTRATIAAAAARLMVEDGITDYYLAKKKAARQLGLPEHVGLPDNLEVAEELRAYRTIYQPENHAEMLRAFRESALQLMELLDDFRPCLTGSVLDGTAGEYSRIDILLFADSAKEAEIFLLNHGISVEHAEPRNERVEAVLVIETDSADANLIVMPATMERVNIRRRDGRVCERIKASGLRELLQQ